MAKRLMDLLLGGSALVLLAPVLALLAAVVCLDSPGPALFRQVRVGRNGVPFTILKFRTMFHDSAERALLQVSPANDPRITRAGRWLRQTKLDELPQLINVVRGDMSLVGPRPEVPRYVDHYSAEDRAIVLSVRPGITDRASIQFRDEASILAGAQDPDLAYIREILPVKLRLYREYVRNRSFLGDLRIIVETVFAIGR